MGLFDSLFNFGANAYMQQQAYENQRALNEQMYDLNKKAFVYGTKYSLTKSPTLSRFGLEKAGYNPLLALNSLGASSFSSPSSSAGVSGTGNPGNLDEVNAYQTLRNNRLMTNASIENLGSQTNQSNAQAELNKEQAITEQAKRTQMEFQNAMYDVEKHLKEKELSWADRKFYSEIYENMQRAENYGAMASIARYNAETERKNSQTNAMNAETNIFNARTSRADSISQHNARQVDLNLRNAQYELSKMKAPSEMARDVAIGIGGLFSLKGLGNSQYSYQHSNQRSKVVRDLHTFGKSRTHK